MMDKKTIGLVVLGIIIIVLAALLLTEKKLGDTAVSINGEAVSMEELRQTYVTYASQSTLPVKEKLLDEVIDAVINYRLLEQESKDLQVDEAKVELQVTNILNTNNIDLDGFSKILTDSGSSLDEYKENIRTDLRITSLLQQELNTSTTEQEVTAYYQQNINNFFVPQTAQVRHIQLDNETPDIVNLSNKIAADLQEKDFCEVARSYSNDNCTTYTLKRGQFIKEYEDVAFTQDIGAISWVNTDQGLFFVQTVNKLDFNPVSLESINQSLTEALTVSKQQTAYQDLISRLRSESDIKILVGGFTG